MLRHYEKRMRGGYASGKGVLLSLLFIHLDKNKDGHLDHAELDKVREGKPKRKKKDFAGTVTGLALAGLARSGMAPSARRCKTTAVAVLLRTSTPSGGSGRRMITRTTVLQVLSEVHADWPENCRPSLLIIHDDDDGDEALSSDEFVKSFNKTKRKPRERGLSGVRELPLRRPDQTGMHNYNGVRSVPCSTFAECPRGWAQRGGRTWGGGGGAWQAARSAKPTRPTSTLHSLRQKE